MSGINIRVIIEEVKNKKGNNEKKYKNILNKTYKSCKILTNQKLNM